ncbi:hypothetical protein [Streptosporangium sp. NPDC049644]|uniref:nSTAND1 domain-containing NTPase n=1 Tax=Streptosporangium sp. NPDC049644 TaxID=3155507 RepID=UPI003414B58E
MYFEASASGHGTINQVAGDQNITYQDGARERLRTEPGSVVRECPYPGLAAFGREQARWFFGRDDLVATLITFLDERLHAGGIQIVVGRSGSGKSSLLRAGLLAKLDQGVLPGSKQWPKLVFTPTADPIQALVTQVSSLTGTDPARVAAESYRWTPMVREALHRHVGREDPGARVVVVVDQFEELFTLCGDEAQRRLFVDLLTRMTTTGTDTGGKAQPAGLVVIGIRADFYDAIADYPELYSAFQDSPLLVGAMSETELREAILYPARDVGLSIGPGLIEVLLRDMGALPGSGENGAAGYEAGRLPLLAHALRASWQQRHGATLTVQGYETTGGIQRAIANTADQVFNRLDPEGELIAQSMILRLIKIGDGTDDTRRRLSHERLISSSADPQMAAAVLDAFTEARLLTRNQDTVEITHEALLRGWPRLRGWIEGDRAGRLTRQELEEAAAAWDREGRDSYLLYQGGRLETTRAWTRSAPHHELTPTAHAFLAASNRQERLTARARTRRIAVLVVFALAAFVASIFAFFQWYEALEQRDTARSNQIVVVADQLRDTDVSLSAWLTLGAHRTKTSDETYGRLVTSENSVLSTALTGHTDTVESVAFSPDGRILASAGKDETIRLWNISGGLARPTPLGGPLAVSSVHSVAFSPDGRTLAGAGTDRTIRLWNVSDPAHPTSLAQPLTGHTDDIRSVMFSPDGRTLASASDDRTIRLWDVSDSAHPTSLGRPLTGHTDIVLSVAFGPDGRTLAGAGADRSIRLWNVSDPARATPVGRPLTGHTGIINSVAFGSDGSTLASASDDRTIRLWNVSDPAQPAPLGQPLEGDIGIPSSVVFSPDGHTLAGASSDRTIRLWNVSDPAQPMPLGRPLTGHTAALRSVAFGPDGRTLASAGFDRSIRLWNLPHGRLIGHRGAVVSVAFSPSGRIMASAGDDRTIRLWNVSDPARPTSLGRPLTGHTDIVVSVAFSPSGRIMASAGDDRTIRLWNVSDPAHPMPLGRPLTGHTEDMRSVAFSPDGRTLASVGEDGVIRLWNISDPAQASLLGSPLANPAPLIFAVAFSPDGRSLASAGNDGSIWLWNVADPARPTRFGQLLPRHASYVYSVVFSPDGRTLASASDDRTIRLWDVSDPARPMPLGSPLTGHTGSVDSVAFSPDGRTLAGAGDDRTIRLWDVSDPAQATTLGPSLTGHGNDIRSVVFGPDGRTLASASRDGTVWLWSLKVDVAIQRICTTVRNPLTAKEWQRYVGNDIPYPALCPT